ncbi:hypothetical protein [Brevibacillus nitrificans]|uniref:hypothetical protein n=1 Tax=Brevibacillus nitrificans TaxID=651560 RepID=UPI002858470D|nr:hypothetical protein [Brevibacillus nitrificans]MDR7316710.1 hypothetical protein [Brevibacillus nitrificans]
MWHWNGQSQTLLRFPFQGDPNQVIVGGKLSAVVSQVARDRKGPNSGQHVRGFVEDPFDIYGLRM